MVLQKRERQLLEFIDTFGAATTTQLQRLFYTDMKGQSARRKAQDRLLQLHKNKYLKRDRSDLNSEYVYYQKKTQFVNHQTLLVDVYLALRSFKGEILEFTPEVVMGEIRPDAKVMFDDGELTHIFLVEIHRNNVFNQEKYETFYLSKVWKVYFQVFPKILIVSDKKINWKPSKLPYIQVPYSLDGLKKIIGR